MMPHVCYRPSSKSMYSKPTDALRSGDRGSPGAPVQHSLREFYAELANYVRMFGRRCAVADYRDDCRDTWGKPSCLMVRRAMQIHAPRAMKMLYHHDTIDGSGAKYRVDGPACEHCGCGLSESRCPRCGWEKGSLTDGK